MKDSFSSSYLNALSYIGNFIFPLYGFSSAYMCKKKRRKILMDMRLLSYNILWKTEFILARDHTDHQKKKELRQHNYFVVVNINDREIKKFITKIILPNNRNDNDFFSLFFIVIRIVIVVVSSSSSLLSVLSCPEIEKYIFVKQKNSWIFSQSTTMGFSNLLILRIFCVMIGNAKWWSKKSIISKSPNL